jgi:hypothetical protein
MSLAPLIRGSSLIAVLVGGIGCANGPCRKLKHPELAPGGAPALAAVNEEKSAPEAVLHEAADGRVFVARPDGSLQCGMKKGLDLNEVEKDLKGIKVYSASKRPDGKVHIQVCGSGTGVMNVYEIPVSSLTDAEKRGFSKFGD